MVLYFYKSLSSICEGINLLFLLLSLSPSLSLKVLTYPIILGNIKFNGLVTFIYPIKYLELFPAPSNSQITILSTLHPKFSSVFCTIKFFFCYCYFARSQHYNIKTFSCYYLSSFFILLVWQYFFCLIWSLFCIMIASNSNIIQIVMWSLIKTCAKYNNLFYILLFYHQNVLVECL